MKIIKTSTLKTSTCYQEVRRNPRTPPLHHHVFQTEAKHGKLHKKQKARTVSFSAVYFIQVFHAQVSWVSTILKVKLCTETWRGYNFWIHVINVIEKFAVRFLEVAGAGFEPAASRLWAWRAASALPRIMCQRTSLVSIVDSDHCVPYLR